MARIILPEKVVSPKDRWSLAEVLDDGKEDGSALAIGEWDGKRRLAMRWNGGEDWTPIGFPRSRGRWPTWFIVPPKYNEAIFQTLPPDKAARAKDYLDGT